MKVNKKLLAIFIILIVVASAIGVYWFFFKPEGTKFGKTLEGYAETPYGESLHVIVNIGGQTSKLSWLTASYQESVSQNVWTVNGTYKSQGKITFSISITIDGTKLSSAQVDNCYIKAVDVADSSSYSYTFGTYPANIPLDANDDGSWNPSSVTRTLDQHVSDIQASTTCSVDYYVYAKISAVGEVSGQTLVVEITETKFLRLNLAKETEGTTATVTPSVTTSSWLEENYKYIVGFSMVAVIAVIIFTKVGDKKCRRRRKVARKH